MSAQALMSAQAHGAPRMNRVRVRVNVEASAGALKKNGVLLLTVDEANLSVAYPTVVNRCKSFFEAEHFELFYFYSTRWIEVADAQGFADGIECVLSDYKARTSLQASDAFDARTHVLKRVVPCLLGEGARLRAT